jgi:heptosyltransferase III
VTTEGSTPAPARAAAADARAILVIHPGALGDVLQAVPALAALRALAGGSRVTLAAQPRIARLLVGAEAVDAALPFDGLGLGHLFADGPIPDAVAARLAAFGRVVSWFGSRAHPYPARLRALQPGAVIAPPVPDGPGAVWSHLLASLAPWGARAPEPVPALTVPAAWRANAAAALEGLGVPRGRPFVLVHPGAGGIAKQWPVEKMAAAVRRAAETGIAVLVHQGPADAGPAAALAATLAAGREPIAAPVLVEPPLETLAAVLVGAAAYLGSDSGVSHLAAAVGVGAVILFAPGTRERWSPWNPRSRALDITPDERDVERAIAALVGPLLREPGGAGPEPFTFA